VLGDGRMTFRPQSVEVDVVTRRRRMPLSQYLAKVGPTVIFEREATLVLPGMSLKPNRDVAPFARQAGRH
jgi:hypothetical protein